MSEIAVIIPHYQDVGRLLRCLDALAAQDRQGIETVVVDNNSADDLDAIPRRHPWIRLVVEVRRGAAEARNRGVTETGAPVLAFLDADCLPAPDWLDRVRALAKTPEMTGARVVGGRVAIFDETPPPRSGAEAFESVFAFDQRIYVEKKGFSVTANLVTSRALFEAVGPFVPGLSEDLDWCRRAVRQGAELIYDGDLSVSHPSRADWPALRRKWQRLTEEAFETTGRQARAFWIAKACAMPLSVIAHTPRMLLHPALAPREKLAGWLTLLRLRLLRARWMLRQAITGQSKGRY